MDGAMGRRRDTSSHRPGMAIWRDVLCSVVRLSRRPVLPATGYLKSFGGLGRTCIIDLNAGKSTAPVEILGDDPQMDFTRSKFPPVVWGVTVDLGHPDER